MRVGLRLKLFLVSVGVILVSFLVADLYLASALDAQLVDRMREDALVRLCLIERDASSSRAPLDDLESWDAFADDVGDRVKGRVTIIRRDGVVIGDSRVERTALRGLANHAGRPEVQEALAHGSGSSVRMSETTHEGLVYVALPFEHDGSVAGVVRLATPRAEVDAAVSRLHWVLAAATIGSLVVAILMSSLAAHWMSRLMRSMTVAARRMSAGDLEVRTHVAGHDEVAELGSALDQLASSLSDAMTQLRTERDLLSGILDGMQEGVLLLDDAGHIVRLNPALRAMLLVGSDAIGRPLLDAVRNADLKELVDSARVEAASGEIDISGLQPRRLLVRAAKLPGSPALLLVCRDVTDVRRLETMRRDFVANVSHELRTPVTAVLSAAETLREGAHTDREATKRFVDIIGRNAERLQRLIEDLLDLSKIESKQLKLTLEPVELRAFLKHSLSLFRERAEKTKVRLRSEVPDRFPPVRADRRALEQVIANLVDNAVKYCPDAPVTLRVEERDHRIAILVQDGGPGIEPKHLPRIFERFYRVDAGRSRELGGTGLGLSIVKHLVEAMDGSIKVESAVGRGTTFVVTLPPYVEPRRGVAQI